MPILLYAIDCLNIDIGQLKMLSTRWNSMFRKIFDYNKWDSVKELIYLLDRLDLMRIVNMRRLLFVQRVSNSANSIMIELIRRYLQGAQLKSVQDEYNMNYN